MRHLDGVHVRVARSPSARPAFGWLVSYWPSVAQALLLRCCAAGSARLTSPQATGGDSASRWRRFHVTLTELNGQGFHRCPT
jgi:hypothetical protein